MGSLAGSEKPSGAFRTNSSVSNSAGESGRKRQHGRLSATELAMMPINRLLTEFRVRPRAPYWWSRILRKRTNTASTILHITTRVALFSLLLGCAVQAQIIPSNRRIAWEGYVGIPGGIPTYPVDKTATAAPYNADKTGANDATAAINSAISDCASDKAVYLPAGTYKVLGAIKLKKHCVLRGAGSGTILQLGDNGEIRMETTLTDSTSIDLASGYTKGSTNLTLSTSSGVAVGEPILIDELNDSSLVERDGTQGGNYLSRNSGSRVLQFIHLVVAKNGNTLTIEPPVPLTLNSSMNPQVYRFVNPSGLMEWAGVEDMKLIHVGESGGTDGFGVEIRYTKYCWVKNVEIEDLCEAGVYMLRTYRNEVRGCYLHHAALNNYASSRAYGVDLWWGSSYNLIEDNICYYLRHSLVIEGGGAGNVFGYNYSDRMFDQFYPDTDYLMGDLLLHGSHPIMNLYEGNVARILYFDNVHGSGSHNTAFRNWLVAESQGANVPWMDWGLTPVGIDQNHVSNNIVANVLGKPSQGPGIYEAKTVTSSPTHYVYILGQPDRANLGTAPGWDQVRGSLLRHCNWDFNTTTNQGVRYDDTGSTSDVNLPASLYRSSKPAFFGSLTWPPIDPRNPSLASITSIPAGYRFVHGTNPVGSTDPVIAISPASYDFGSVAVGSATNATFTVRNVGGGTLTGTVSVGLPFSILGSSSYSLGSNASQVVTVRYLPTLAGNDRQTLTWTGGGGATATVSGSGWAVLSSLSFDSTAGTISGPFTIGTDQTISQSVESLDPASGGLAVYRFSITNAADYIVSAAVYGPADDGNSFFVNIDAEPTDPAMIWDFPMDSGFANRTVTWRASGGVSPQVWHLGVGTHQLIVRGREAGAKLGHITIFAYRPVSPPPPPSNLRIVGSN